MHYWDDDDREFGIKGTEENGACELCASEEPCIVCAVDFHSGPGLIVIVCFSCLRAVTTFTWNPAGGAFFRRFLEHHAEEVRREVAAQKRLEEAEREQAKQQKWAQHIGRLRTAASSGTKIETIKWVREIAGIGLKEAKELVEALTPAGLSPETVDQLISQVNSGVKFTAEGGIRGG